METIFKLLVARLIQKTSKLFKQMDQIPMMKNNYLMSVVYIDFKKLNPKQSLDTNVYIQIVLLHAMGYIHEFFDYIKDETQKNQSVQFLHCHFFTYLIDGSVLIKNSDQIELLQDEINKFIYDERISEKKKNEIIMHGRCDASRDKGEDEYESGIPLALILNEWMQFKDLK